MINEGKLGHKQTIVFFFTATLIGTRKQNIIRCYRTFRTGSTSIRAASIIELMFLSTGETATVQEIRQCRRTDRPPLQGFFGWWRGHFCSFGAYGFVVGSADEAFGLGALAVLASPGWWWGWRLCSYRYCGRHHCDQLVVIIAVILSQTDVRRTESVSRLL